jgi:uncharacterized protein YqeY
MSIAETINHEIKEAMKAKQEDRLRALRSIKAALLLLSTASGNKQIEDTDAIKAIQKLAKQRKDSIGIFSSQQRHDLVEKEQSELIVLESFLPQPLSEKELEEAITAIIRSHHATSPSDFGKLMPLAMKELSGKADGSSISGMLKKLLS